jgi:hypothetical protein
MVLTVGKLKNVFVEPEGRAEVPRGGAGMPRGREVSGSRCGR